MAQPSPIFVTPSTTFVQVTTLQTPYTPVILNAYSYAGQVVSVLDGTSSFGVLASSIVVSTAQTSQFSDGSISTLIDQLQEPIYKMIISAFLKARIPLLRLDKIVSKPIPLL